MQNLKLSNFEIKIDAIERYKQKVRSENVY